MKIHIVQRGDTLWSIAEKHGVSFEEVQKLNAHLANPDMIVPGMKIKLPDTATVMEKSHPYANNKPLAYPPLMEETKEMEENMPSEPELTMPENWMTEPAPVPAPSMPSVPQSPSMPSVPQAPPQMEMEMEMEMPSMPSLPPQMENEMMMPCPPIPCYFVPVPYPMPYMHQPYEMMPESEDHEENESYEGHENMHYPNMMMPRCPYCHR
ncbi:LysM peptidoglycan-binding domain-containing protein [Domibacillus robiginosus]|uniref:LysM peptidoglycan-binding domain-containing protein n=1 Tax=Domibacillus robiginosus TaxID=1071054 RepID=UPI00067DEAB3|nr:LysM domain-containing protein [Domibacillus robiginosus]